jgi:hypothetical protein
MIRGHDRLRARVLSGCAATEGSKRKASGACRPLRREPGSCGTIECSPQTGCPVSRPKIRKAPDGNDSSPPRLQVVLEDVAGSLLARPGSSALAVDTRAARPVAKARPPVPAFVRDLIHEVLASGASGVSCKRCYAHPLRAARSGTRSADRPVCTSMWITCAKRHQACAHAVEMLGIPPAARPHIRVFSWENTTHTLYTQRKLELSTRRAAMPPE